MITTDTMGIIICCIRTTRPQKNILQAWILRQLGTELFGFVLSILRLKSTHFDEAVLGTKIATRCCTCWKHKHDVTMVQIYMYDRDRFAMTKIYLWPDWRSETKWKYIFSWGMDLCQYQSMTGINSSVFGDVWDWHEVVSVHLHFLMSEWLISVFGYVNLWSGDKENELWMAENVLVVWLWESNFRDSRYSTLHLWNQEVI